MRFDCGARNEASVSAIETIAPIVSENEVLMSK